MIWVLLKVPPLRFRRPPSREGQAKRKRQDDANEATTSSTNRCGYTILDWTTFTEIAVKVSATEDSRVLCWTRTENCTSHARNPKRTTVNLIRFDTFDQPTNCEDPAIGRRFPSVFSAVADVHCAAVRRLSNREKRCPCEVRVQHSVFVTAKRCHFRERRGLYTCRSFRIEYSMRLVRMDVGLSCGSGESCIFLNLSLPIAEEGASVFLSLFNLTFAMMK